MYLFVSKDELGITKISQTFTCQSGRPTVATITDKEASSSVSESDTSRVFYGWAHRGINLHHLLMIVSELVLLNFSQETYNVELQISKCNVRKCSSICYFFNVWIKSNKNRYFFNVNTMSFLLLTSYITPSFLFMSSISFASKHNYLAQVTSNIWGTKFKIVGLASFLPANLGAGKCYLKATHVHITLTVLMNLNVTVTFFCISVIYKTSLLHLQPRQMTIYLPEVRKISHDFMSLPVFNPNVFSEDEDDLPGVNEY